jgi:hypothetical protein
MCSMQSDMTDSADPCQTATGLEHDIECRIVLVKMTSDWKHCKVGLFTARVLTASFSTF